MCARCDRYDKFVNQAKDAGLMELAKFLEEEKSWYIDAAVENDLRD